MSTCNGGMALKEMRVENLCPEDRAVIDKLKAELDQYHPEYVPRKPEDLEDKREKL